VNHQRGASGIRRDTRLGETDSREGATKKEKMGVYRGGAVGGGGGGRGGGGGGGVGVGWGGGGGGGGGGGRGGVCGGQGRKMCL